jgi:hypothetical protein
MKDHTIDRPESGRYEIRLAGLLDPRWVGRFDGLTLSHDAAGITVLSGPIADQAALHGLLQRVRDLGLPLVSVARLPGEREEPSSPQPTERTDT